jgi:hypothetical protein
MRTSAGARIRRGVQRLSDAERKQLETWYCSGVGHVIADDARWRMVQRVAAMLLARASKDGRAFAEIMRLGASNEYSGARPMDTPETPHDDTDEMLEAEWQDLTDKVNADMQT